MLVAPMAFAHHPKTDVVTLDDGSILVGEIRSATAGTLQLSTSAAGTVDIEWFQVTGLESEYEYQVEDYQPPGFQHQYPRRVRFGATGNRHQHQRPQRDHLGWLLVLSLMVGQGPPYPDLQ
jgi:hypothetical protein